MSLILISNWGALKVFELENNMTEAELQEE